jgi:cell division protein FtsB
MKINWTEVFSAVSGSVLIAIASFLYQTNNTLISVGEKVTNFNSQIQALEAENRDLEARIRQLEIQK